MKNHFGCPVQATSNVVSGKRKVLIVWHLGFRSLRNSDLLKLLPGVSQKVLTAQLRELEGDGIVGKVDAHTASPRVDYFLTDAGKELLKVMESMCAWAAKHLGIAPTLPNPGGVVAPSEGIKERSAIGDMTRRRVSVPRSL
jgi:DNA-binding HxlR family transcriptional regulator